MGNQMQDRVCAHIVPAEPGEQENAVIWRIPPDDFSSNAAECVVAAAGQNSTQTVRITAPTGESAVILVKEAQGVLISRRGVIVGALLRYLDTFYGPRLRLVLAPTAWRAGVSQPCPAGNWGLSFHHRDDVRIWILRDDRDRAFDKAQPHRASDLYDPSYRVHDEHGAYIQVDDPACAVVRAGTASLLATGKSALAVAATETLGTGRPQIAWYSGTRTSRRDAEVAVWWMRVATTGGCWRRRTGPGRRCGSAAPRLRWHWRRGMRWVCPRGRYDSRLRDRSSGQDRAGWRWDNRGPAIRRG